MDLDSRALFSHFALPPDRRLIVAVSGGSDSLALLLLVKEFLPPDRELLAVTVDHGLRPESATEAMAVARLCMECGIAHRTMVWRGAKPATGLIAAAREARYDLLSEAAGDFGSDLVLVAHTMDDQAETVWMRMARTGTGTGLAGMAETTLFDGRVWILRPLLGQRRSELRAYLQRRGVTWIDDPSNDDLAYERVRARAALSGDRVEMLAARARREGHARMALARAAAGVVSRHAEMASPGLFRLSRDLCAPGVDDAAAVHALRALLAVAGGVPRLADLSRTQALFSKLRDGAVRATLSRAAIDARRSGIWIRREARNVAEVPLHPPVTIWDGRWRIGIDREMPQVAVAPLGARHPATLSPGDAAIPESLARAAFSVEPGLFRDGRLVAPLARSTSPGLTAYPVVAPFARFAPGFDLALAEALSALVGAPPPPTPFNNHIAVEA